MNNWEPTVDLKIGNRDTSHIFLAIHYLLKYLLHILRIAITINYPHHITQRGSNRETFFEDQDNLSGRRHQQADPLELRSL